jgi:hypothetical protein
MKLVKCKWCGANPSVKEQEGQFWVECQKCGANSWRRKTKELAARIWGGDTKGDGYQQFEGNK